VLFGSKPKTRLTVSDVRPFGYLVLNINERAEPTRYMVLYLDIAQWRLMRNEMRGAVQNESKK
jgi:hypothetical protein